MSEKRILLASLLKPISDTRMYEKLGVSLSKLPGAIIHICGYQAPEPADAPSNITFHPIFDFRRLSADRLKAQAKFYRLLLQIKPELIIVTTHELLLVSQYYKRKHGGRIIYDIQENYSLNLRAQHNYAWPLRQLLAWGVRTTEQLAAPSIDHFLLAERSYAEELAFPGNRYTVVENKYKANANQASPTVPVTIPAQGPLQLLYSGTIAAEYGVWEAIALTEQLHQLNPHVGLTIIGYCANAHTWSKLKQVCLRYPFIELFGGDRLVPHTQILEKIRQSHIGLLPYQPNASTFRCIPTKLYEYMAHALPVLIQQNPLWQTIVEGSGAGISLDFRKVDAQQLYTQLHAGHFYEQGIPQDIYWESEEQKLLQVISNMA